jgi:O-6-methylguanine DNA methyltransferase
MQCICKYPSPFGDITLASNGQEIIGLWFDNQKYFASTLLSEYKKEDLSVFKQTKEWLDCYFSGYEPAFTPPLKLMGTPFRLRVWEILRTIPYGSTMTYKAIATILAKQMGIKQMSSQAVGGAVGHNPISIIVPCHRVIGLYNSLTGYAAGVKVKQSLLAIEKITL